MTPTERLAAARRTLRRERERTADEREAFVAFRRAVRDVPARDRPASSAPPLVPATTGLSAGPSGEVRSPAGTRTVREAYERTVMGVPHYEEEYGDTLVESLETEFPPEVATGLTTLDRLTPGLKRAVLDATDAALAEREEFLGALDAETDSLRGSTDRLVAVAEEVDALADEPMPDFGAQDAVRARLGALADRCDAIADDRQTTLREWRDRFDPPAGIPDLPRYLYADLDATYPVLAAVAATGERVTRLRRRVEREMSGGPRDDADVRGTVRTGG